MDAGASAGASLGGGASASAGGSIASESDLEAFSRLPLEDRSLTDSLRGVLAESALTGRIRYKWSLLRPLVDYAMEEVLLAYDAETRVEVGPPGPDNITNTVDRFKALLAAFSDAPWTFQRMCEILLEPKKQYTRLPKLVLAFEKCLMVTTSVPPTPAEELPPPPLLGSLGPINVNPPAVYQSTSSHHQAAGAHGSGGGPDESSAFTHTVLELRHHLHPHLGNHTGMPEHIEEDHWPVEAEGRGPFKPAVIHRPAAGHAPTGPLVAVQAAAPGGGGPPVATASGAADDMAIGIAPAEGLPLDAAAAAGAAASSSTSDTTRGRPSDAIHPRDGAHPQAALAGVSGAEQQHPQPSGLGRRRREPDEGPDDRGVATVPRTASPEPGGEAGPGVSAHAMEDDTAAAAASAHDGAVDTPGPGQGGAEAEGMVVDAKPPAAGPDGPERGSGAAGGGPCHEGGGAPHEGAVVDMEG